MKRNNPPKVHDLNLKKKPDGWIFLKKSTLFSGGYRVSQRAPTAKVEMPTYHYGYFSPQNSMKVKTNIERGRGEVEWGGGYLVSPLDPPMLFSN